MEAKLDKLFSIFDEYKKNNLFRLCIRQIVEIHKECPGSISYILKKTLKLIFSTTNDYRLQLEHRQIAAGIIEKTYKTHTESTLRFLQHQLDDIPSQSLFHFEQIGEQEQDQELNKEPTLEQQQIMSKKQDQDQEHAMKNEPQLSSEGSITCLADAFKYQYIKWQNVDFNHLFKYQKPLLSKNLDEFAASSEIDCRRTEEEILKRFGLVQNFSEANISSILFTVESNEFQMPGSDTRSQKSGGDESGNEIAPMQKLKKSPSPPPQSKKGKKAEKRQEKINVQKQAEGKLHMMDEKEQKEKKNKKRDSATTSTPMHSDCEQPPSRKKIKHEGQMELEKQTKKIQTKVVNPYNIIFEQCMTNLLHSNWEIRHGSALVLRAFLKEKLEFLGFEYTICENPEQLLQLAQQEGEGEQRSATQCYKLMLEQVRSALRSFVEDETQVQRKVQNYLARNLILIALDRFADFVSEKSNIIVRETSCNMLTMLITQNQGCYLKDHQLQPILQLLKIFLQQKEWEILQSSLFLINQILIARPDLRRYVFHLFCQDYLTLLKPQQIDDVIYNAAEGLLFLAENETFFLLSNETLFISGEDNFRQIDYLKDLVEQVWHTIDQLDDLAYSLKILVNLLSSIYSRGNLFTLIHLQKDYGLQMQGVVQAVDCLQKLYKIFNHRTLDVRCRGYGLVVTIILKIHELSNFQFFFLDERERSNETTNLITKSSTQATSAVAKQSKFVEDDSDGGGYGSYTIIFAEKQQQVLKNIFTLAVQTLIAEEEPANCNLATKMITITFPLLTAEYKKKGLDRLREMATSMERTYALTKSSFDLLEDCTHSLQTPYGYAENYSNSCSHLDSTYFRLFKIASTISQLLLFCFQSSRQLLTTFMLKDLKQASQRIHRHLLLLTSTLCNVIIDFDQYGQFLQFGETLGQKRISEFLRSYLSHVTISNTVPTMQSLHQHKYIVDFVLNLVNKSDLETYLGLDFYDMESLDLAIIDEHIAANLQSIGLLLLNLDSTKIVSEQFHKCLLLFKEGQITSRELIIQRRQSYESIFTNLSNLKQKHQENPSLFTLATQQLWDLVHSTLCLIENFVLQAEDLASCIKVQADYLYLEALQTEEQKRPPEKMNIVVKPLINKISKEKFLAVSHLASLGLFHLLVLLKFQGAAPKIIQNTLNGVTASKKTGAKLSAKKPKQKEDNPTSNDQTSTELTVVNAVLMNDLYARKSLGINTLLSLLFQHLKQQVFLTIPTLRESLQIPTAPPQTSNNGIDNDSQQWLTQNSVNLVNRLRLIRKLTPALKDLSQHNYIASLIESLFELTAKLNLVRAGTVEKAVSEEQTNTFDQIFKQVKKIITIFFLAFLQHDFTSLSLFDKEYEQIFNRFLELLYKAVKLRQVSSYLILEDILQENAESFVDYASIYVLQIVKSLTSSNPIIQEKAYKMLGSFITSLFLQQNLPNKGSGSNDSSDNGNIKSSVEVNTSYQLKVITLSPYLQKKKQKGTKFILDFKNSSNFDYTVSFPVRAELRHYQEDGIKWLAFLIKYKLNGALCDDMGLGKTIQMLAVIQNELGKDLAKKRMNGGEQSAQIQQNIQTKQNNKKDQKHKSQKNKKNQIPAAAENKLEETLLPSLIITPTTLTEHWKNEIKKFLNPDVVLQPLIMQPSDLKESLVELQQELLEQQQLQENGDSDNNNKFSDSGPNSVFQRAADQVRVRLEKKHRIWITSYHTMQKFIDILACIPFKFCVLDEGHLIKNPKNKFALATRRIMANHKFLLSGTPIQNNLHELWAIFDFLMPNYLGSEEGFKKHFSKLFTTNILTFTDDSLLFTTQQNRVLKDLHQRVMPFILRRDKQHVLQELPQKIIQDYFCQLTDVQNRIYTEMEDLEIKNCESQLLVSTEQAQSVTKSAIKEEEQACKSVLQTLVIVRKLLNHPLMLLHGSGNFTSKQEAPLGEKKKKNKSEADNSEFNNSRFGKMISSICSLNELQNYESSGKFVALKQLMNDLGFEDSESSSDNEKQLLNSINNKNKLLIFTRFKETITLITEYLFKELFPHIRYLKLSGDVPISKRYDIVNRFNEDLEYKILLLTTSIGGLGLNLSSANIVIMFDHDYNPMNDLQAIDRAHRIGQKNTLNVYRLITKDTLEEKIMGIQKFKINVANAIINLDNATIKNVQDSNIVQLFDTLIPKEEKAQEQTNKDSESKFMPYSKILAGMVEEMWEEQDYNKQY